VFIFRRLKINHESHEFILDPGTVANSSSVLYVLDMISWFPPPPSSSPLTGQWEDEKLCVYIHSLVYNLVRPKKTTEYFVQNDVLSMILSLPYSLYSGSNWPEVMDRFRKCYTFWTDVYLYFLVSIWHFSTWLCCSYVVLLCVQLRKRTCVRHFLAARITSTVLSWQQYSEQVTAAMQVNKFTRQYRMKIVLCIPPNMEQTAWLIHTVRMNIGRNFFLEMQKEWNSSKSIFWKATLLHTATATFFYDFSFK
jgi:hypothetical protein